MDGEWGWEAGGGGGNTQRETPWGCRGQESVPKRACG